MATQIKFKRGTRANLDTLALGGDLITGEPIYITDEDRVAICTSTTTYETFAKESEVIASGMTNPMTTSGDIIYGGSSGTPTRLPKGTDGQVLSLSSGVPSWQNTSGGGGVWVTFTGTRTSNTTFTVSNNKTSIFSKGLVIKWKESTDDKVGMVISSVYSSGTTLTTVTIVGDTCNSSASNFNYSILPVEIVRFAIAGTIGSTGTNVANSYYANYDIRVLGADLQAGTAGTTDNTTIDINAGGITMFSVKPTLATTAVVSPSAFTANNGTSLTMNNQVTIDIDAVQTTPCVDLYVQLYIFQTRLLNLN